MSGLSNVFHHFAFTHPQTDPSSLESRRTPADNNVFSLKVDLRESTSAYFLEAELPGIHGSNDISIRWLDGNTIQIQVTIQKTDLKLEWSDALSHDRPREKVLSAGEYTDMGEERNGFERKIQVQDAGQKGSPEGLLTRFWLDERRTGVYMRNFSFAIDVDTDAVRVRLRQGLLKFFIPKMNTTAFKSKEIRIEAT
jgi:HSP20 family molecular chaperone IbpA